MKKLNKSIQIILFILLCYYDLKAQSDVYWDDLNINHTICSPSILETYMFPDVTFPEWKWGVTHGSPNCGGNTIFMWHEKQVNKGEGTFLNYYFQPNTLYYISISIKGFDLTSNSNGKINIKLLPNLLNNNICPIESGEEIPIYMTSPNVFVLLQKNTANNLPITTFELTFRTSTQDYNSLVIYPEDLDALNLNQVSLVVDCIFIKSVCDGSITTYDKSIQDGVIRKKGINIGSSYGANSTQAENSIKNTELLGEFINFNHNTLITPKNNGTFLALAQNCETTKYKYNLTPSIYESPNVGCNNKSSKEIETLNELEFNIYPNPASDILKLNIQNSDSEKVEVIIYDLFGKVVFTNNLKDIKSNNLETDLDIKNIPNGEYIFIIKSNQQTKQKRLTINK